MGFWDIAEEAANIGSLGAYDALTADGADGPIKKPKIDQSAFARGGVGADATEQQYTAAASDYRTEGDAAMARGQAGADATRAAGTQGYNHGWGRAGQQDAQGQQIQAQQQTNANMLQTQGQNAHTRQNPTYSTSVQDQARSQQYDALGGVRQQAATGADTSAIRDFYSGPRGPSAAEAQMLAGREAAMGDALALSRSGRAGFNPAAERQAMFQNAATSAQTNQNLATLRAQEEATARGQNLQAMTAEQQAIAAGRQAQLNALGLEQQSLAGIGAAGATDARAAAEIALGGRAQNDSLALGYQNASQQAAALGVNAGLGYTGLGNQSVAGAQSYNVGMQNAATGQEGVGVQAYGTAGQLGLGYQGLAEQVQQNEMNAGMQYEALASGQNLAVQNANVQSDASRDAAWMGMAGGVAGMAAMASDERSKEKIRELEGQLDTYRALMDDANVDYPTDRASATADALDAHRGAGAYEFSYKDPSMPGAGPGRFSGPMSHELRSMPGVVQQGPDGYERVDGGRLVLNNTSAIAETVRRDDAQDEAISDMARALDVKNPYRERARRDEVDENPHPPGSAKARKWQERRDRYGYDRYGIEHGAENPYGERATGEAAGRSGLLASRMAGRRPTVGAF
jgi:hypothetical protein